MLPTQVGSNLGETLNTLLTRIRLISTVQLYVSLQMSRLSKTFVTLLRGALQKTHDKSQSRKMTESQIFFHKNLFRSVRTPMPPYSVKD